MPLKRNKWCQVPRPSILARTFFPQVPAHIHCQKMKQNVSYNNPFPDTMGTLVTELQMLMFCIKPFPVSKTEHSKGPYLI